MTDKPWRITVWNGDGSRRARASFSHSWALDLALRIVLWLRIGDSLEVRGPGRMFHVCGYGRRR